MIRLFPIMIMLGIASIIGLAVFIAVDIIGVEDQYGIGRLVDKKFVPEHTVTTSSYSDFCKCIQISTTYYDDAWSVQVNMTGYMGWIEVSQSLHNQIPLGDKVYITYSKGRLSNGVYFKAVEILE